MSPRTVGRALALGVLALSLAACRQDTTDEWRRFRGPLGQGISAASPLPAAFDRESGVVWKAEIPGQGTSSPVVSGGRVYLTTAEWSGAELGLDVVALELATGELVWRRRLTARPEEKKHPLNSSASPTPVTDGKAIYAWFGSHLVALDLEGEVRWTHEIDPKYIEYSHYGAGASPVLTEDAVVVFNDRETLAPGKPGWMAAYDKENGEELWRRQWVNTCCSYATPIVVRRGKEEEVIAVHAGRVSAYHARSGKGLWQRTQAMNQPVAGAMYADEILCVASGVHHDPREGVCWRLRGTGRDTRMKELWRETDAIASTSTPLFYDGLIFLTTDNGIMSCRDAETGAQLWKTRLPSGSYYASLVGGDGKVFAVSNYGVITAVAASRELQILAESPLEDGPVIATPAIAGGCFLVRTGKHLYCLDASAAAAGRAAAATAAS